MTPAEWSQCHYFQPTRVWGDPSLINKELVIERLEPWAQFIANQYGWKPIVLEGTQGGHENHSEHYDGDAVDLYVTCENSKPSLLDVFFSAVRFGFESIGVYPDWQCDGTTIDGLHLGVRYKGHMALWLGVRVPDPNHPGSTIQVYEALDAANLKKYGVI